MADGDLHTGTENVTVVSSVLPAGASTSAKQDTGNTSLSSIDSKLTNPLPVSAASLPLPSGASTEATLALIKAKTDNLDVALSTRTKPADTQAISAVSLPLPSGAATETTLSLLEAETLRDSYQNLTFNLKGYACASPLVNIATATETDFILFKNVSGSTVVRLYEQLLSIPDSAQTVRTVLRVYMSPTITSNGTAITINGIRSGQSTSICEAYYLPTISARGTLTQTYGAINTPTVRFINLTRFVEPGASFLITAQPSSSTTNHAFSQTWAEGV